MKKLILALLIICSSLISVSAGNLKGGPDYDKLKTELKLTDEQVNNLKSIHEKYKNKFKEIKEKELNEEAKKEEFKKVRNAKQAEIKSVLTADQYTAWEKFKKEQRLQHRKNKTSKKDCCNK